MDDSYAEPETKVLRNRYGITQRHMLELQVRLDASAAELELRRHDTPIRFNARYLRDLHRELFKRSYDWAGDLRTREIGIGDNSGVPTAQLATRLEVLFGQLRRESELRRLTDGAQWADRAGYYWAS